MTISRSQLFDIIEQRTSYTAQYVDDVLVRMAHHSSAIEGNTLTLSDAITLLVDERTPTAGKTMRELYEVANHREAFAMVINHAMSEEDLTVDFIQSVHACLLDRIQEDRGQWKKTTNAILGAKIDIASPEQVPWLMMQWAENAQWQSENLVGEHLMRAVADAHADFEITHPFSDGNGRTGRMFMIWQSLRATGIPVIIEIGQRDRYINALQDNDRLALARLIAEQWAYEKERQRLFSVTGTSPVGHDALAAPQAKP